MPEPYSGVEHVNGLDGCLALLLEAEHQVDPLAQGLGHLLRLQRLTVDQYKEPGVVPGPGGQVHMVDPLAVLTHPEVEPCRRPATV